MKGYNRRLAIDPFEEKEVVKDNSLRTLVAVIVVIGLVIFFIL